VREMTVVVYRFNAAVYVNGVARRRARLVLRWVTLAAPVSRWGRGRGGGTGPRIVARLRKFRRTLDILWSIDSQKKISKFDVRF